MPYSLGKMETRIKFEDIMFWIVIAGLIGIALWMLSGSPTEVGAIIGVGTFATASDMLIWKKIYSIDKSSAIGFMKVKHNLERLNNKFDDMYDKLDKIERKL